MQLFNADAKILLENLKKNLCQQKVEKNHLKKLHTYGSWEGFFSAAQTAQNSPKQPKISFPFYKFFYPIVSAKISG